MLRVEVQSLQREHEQTHTVLCSFCYCVFKLIVTPAVILVSSICSVMVHDDSGRHTFSSVSAQQTAPLGH